jgi:predicted metal-dependent hydrolase
MIAADRIPDRPPQPDAGPAEPGSVPPVRVLYNPRRRRRASARFEGGGIVVELPAAVDRDKAEDITIRLVAGLLQRRRAMTAGDGDLARRAQDLADRYLDGVRAASVRWSDRQDRRWGSCSLPGGDIRLSERLRPVPGWVLDAVLVHELAHLQVAGHGPGFRALAGRFARGGEASVFLEGFGLGLQWDKGEGAGGFANQCQ